MSVLKTACLTIASVSVLAMAPTAFAKSGNITKTSVANGVNTQNISLRGGTGGTLGGHVGPMLLNSSETATFFYKKGLKHFQKGNLEKSEYAFRAVLRADGSKEMDRLTLSYLTLISEKQGNLAAKEKYAQAYSELDKE